MAATGSSVDEVVWARALGASTAPELADQVGAMCGRTSEALDIVEGIRSSASNVPDDEITEGLAHAARSLEAAQAALQAVHRKVLS